ncbi:MAG: hypothetical protein Q7S59_06610 [Sulfurimonas sp.]|nr:hypothetical protein [Sulfurimonas sp.]
MKIFNIILIALALAVLGIVAQSVYVQINKTSPRSSRLECHKKSVVYEKIVVQEKIQTLQNAIKAGNFSVNMTIQKSHYMKTKLFEHLDKKRVEQVFLDKLAKLKADVSAIEKAAIELTIYENDKLDPGKKTEEAKKYAGYLIYEFKINGSLIYKIQIDFMDNDGKDIDEKLSCAITSLMSL